MLVAYLLVIYYHNGRSYVTCMWPVFSDRIGDVALLMICTWMINFGSSFHSKSTSELLLGRISVRKLKLCYRHPSYFRCHRPACPRVNCDCN